MPAPVEHRVTSLSGFTQLVERSLEASRALYPDDRRIVNWYRGCGRSTTHKLLPTLYRHPTIIDADELLKLERDMLEWFRRESILHHTITQYVDPEEPGLELLFFMQHYSVPTRLLDWTLNPYIGLYFAVTAAEFDDNTGEFVEDAAVWILNPNAWNARALDHVTWGSRGALSIEDPEKDQYAPRKSLDPVHLTGMSRLPAAMRGIPNNTRMFAQKGVFTIFGRDLAPMETSFEDHNYHADSLVKVVIEKNHINSLMDQVLAVGYTDSVSYPDLHGLAMEMRRSFGFKV